MLNLKVQNASGATLSENAREDSVYLVYTMAYEKGDAICLDVQQKNAFVWIQFEDSMPPALVYSPDGVLFYPVPPEDNRLNHSPKSFTGECHLIRAWLPSADEIEGCRCLSFNPYDGHEATGYFPHATANVETRGESVFFARNAIDGVFANDSHGAYPYESWGINRDPNAALTLDFGRTITTAEICITIRCDFPHDSYWTKATLAFDDGSEEVVGLEKVAHPQSFKIAKTTRKITLKNLIKADDPSPFPALTQIEVYGK